MNTRKMPDRVQLGQSFNGPMMAATRFAKGDNFDNPEGLRTVLGWLLPPWQRGFVWTDDQCVSFIESIWRGIPLGTYTINMAFGSRFDGWLIDGQQRMRALERYLADELPVFGYRWSEITEVDRRMFGSFIWNYYETRSDDEVYLRSYYNLMNFGGTAHKEDERA
jgi:hypothetical protein